MSTLDEYVSDSSATSEGDLVQYLYFYLTTTDCDPPDKLADEGYALPMADIAEILRVPTLNRVPLSDPVMLGVTNLRGSVLPVVSLRRLVGQSPEVESKQSRILVLKGDHPLGLWVDWVEKVAAVPKARLDRSDNLRGTTKHALLAGFIRPDPGAGQDHTRLRRLLSAEALASASRTAPVQSEESAGGGSERLSANTTGSEPTQQFLCFALGNQSYALNIQQIKEVVRVPKQQEPVSGMPEHIFGMMPLRNLMVPLVNLATFYGVSPLSAATQAAQHRDARVVVVPVGSREGNAFLGLLVDRITQVVTLAERRIQPVPDLLSNLSSFHDISGMIRMDSVSDTIALLDVRRLITHQVMRTATEQLEDNEVLMQADTEQLGDETQFVVFQLDQEEYGVAIETTKEILRVPDTLTHVPQADSFVEGVINLRGMVLPVIDLRKRFALPRQERNKRQRIVVLNLNGQRTGFIVDAVREVLKVPRSQIEMAPTLSPEQNTLITEMANLAEDKRMILLFDVERLVSEHEARKLSRLSAEVGTGAQLAEH